MSTVTRIGADIPRSTPSLVLAVIAHDRKKEDLLRLVRSHRPQLDGLRLVATRATGLVLQQEIDVDIELVDSGPEGGDLQIGARVVEQQVDALIFLRDPSTAHPHEPDIQALLKVCDIHGIPVATNLASAEIVLHFLADHIRRVRETRALHPAGGV
jgi:methylglyoxal synthase